MAKERKLPHPHSAFGEPETTRTLSTKHPEGHTESHRSHAMAKKAGEKSQKEAMRKGTMRKVKY